MVWGSWKGVFLNECEGWRQSTYSHSYLRLSPSLQKLTTDPFSPSPQTHTHRPPSSQTKLSARATATSPSALNQPTLHPSSSSATPAPAPTSWRATMVTVGIVHPLCTSWTVCWCRLNCEKGGKQKNFFCFHHFKLQHSLKPILLTSTTPPQQPRHSIPPPAPRLGNRLLCSRPRLCINAHPHPPGRTQGGRCMSSQLGVGVGEG